MFILWYVKTSWYKIFTLEKGLEIIPKYFSKKQIMHMGLIIIDHFKIANMIDYAKEKIGVFSVNNY